ncbi:MAG: hypothetical protein NVSMB7_04190 [Chitinophagaceae bacterium]
MNTCCKKIRVVFLIVFIQLLLLPGHAQQVKRPPLTGIAFAELQVSNIKKSTGFYTNLLGYTLIPGKTGADKKIHLYDIRISGRQSIKIQDGLPAGHDERLLSLAFQTTDAEAFRIYLQSKGVKVPPVIHKEMEGGRWFEVTDPDNHPIKFVQFTTAGQGQLKQEPQLRISSRILHAGLTIAAAAAADAFYKDILGFSEIWRGGSSDSVTNWINMRLPESTDYLEYMLVNGQVNRQQLGSLHHIALMVPDMQQALDTLNNRILIKPYTVAAPRVGRNKRWQLNLFDPDGTRIELMEPFPMR